MCQYVDSCKSQPCGLNAKCTVDSVGSYSCTCDRGYIGTHCDQDVNECIRGNGPCEHGTCINTNGSYLCNCKLGYTGKCSLEDFEMKRENER